MADWVDVLALLVTLAVVGGAMYGISCAVGLISEGVQSTKEALKEKGLDISDSGVAVKTSRRLNREDYVDATQRGFVKAMGAASFGKADGTAPKSLIPGAPPLHRTASSSSEEKKKRGLFGIRKARAE